MALEKKVVDSDIRRSWSGLVAGVVIAILSICVGGYLVHLGHDWGGGTIATASVVGLVSTFIYGTRSQRQERIEKTKIMTGKK